MPDTHDRPWRRPGTFHYARKRLRAAVRPPVTVYAAPADLVKDHDVPVTMSDGTVLRLNAYRPPGNGPFPVILSAHPYGKDVLPTKTRRGWSFSPQYRIMNQPEPVRFSEQTSWEAPDPVWWVAQGYAVVNADTRGGGHSDGVGDLFSDQEAHDIYELIEWAAAQPWSNGNVGMMGVSYLAISQYKVAALNPPSLKAICPWEGFTDAYSDFFMPGGIVENGFARIWLFMTKRGVRVRTDMAAERRLHPLRDQWWATFTPDLANVTVPMLVCTSFSDNSLHSTGSMRAFQEASSEDRFAYSHRGAKWATFYGDDATRTQLAFFDRYLRGRDVPKPPRMRLELRDTREHVVEVREEQEWPLARTDWQKLHLASNGELRQDQPAAGSVSLDLRKNAASFSHTFEHDTELSGPMALDAWLQCTGTNDPHIFVGVEKWSGGRYVPFEGSYGYGRDRLASGRLRAALRGLDQGSRQDMDGGTPHTRQQFRTLRLLHGDEMARVRIPLTSSATLFRAGDTLRLLIAGRYLEPRNPLFGHFPTHYEPSPGGTLTLHWGPDRPCALEIPVIPRRSACPDGGTGSSEWRGLHGRLNTLHLSHG